MKTDCNELELEFQGLAGRKVVASFDGGQIGSDAGGLLLRETDLLFGIVARFSRCFTDHRDAALIEHSVEELLRQRIYGIALGYEDLNDHDRLRHDPLLATLVGKSDPTGQSRVQERDKGKALAGKSTLNRLELTGERVDPSNRYQKIVADTGKIARFFAEIFLQRHATAPERIVLDLDATDDPLHGDQEGKFFHGYYDAYCYLPLYIFCGSHLLCATLREANIDGADGAVDELRWIVAQIREQWPEVQIVIRGDSGFCREEIMEWCEKNDVEYILGLAKNKVLKRSIAEEMAQAKALFEETQEPARVFKDFTYKTQTSWSRARRVIGKAEHVRRGENPRFVVTSLARETIEARELYEDHYCARGDMENRIKEQQLDMFADRTSTHAMRSNQLRLWLSSAAYVLVDTMREVGLRGTRMARAQCGTIRQRLLKIGARVKISVRRIWLSTASAHPCQDIFIAVYNNLRAIRCAAALAPG